MMSKKRRFFSAAFKAKVAMEAFKGVKTTVELANQYQVHPTQVALWKKQMLENAERVFEAATSKAENLDEPDTAELQERVRKLKMQVDWLTRKVAEHGG